MNFMARESGVDAFLRKPEDTELLVRTIATLREDRAQMGRVAARTDLAGILVLGNQCGCFVCYNSSAFTLSKSSCRSCSCALINKCSAIAHPFRVRHPRGHFYSVTTSLG